MFSFHKPKIYRSLYGCCICRAKSSSSRFTDSRKYEDDFGKCFKIAEARSGEICNACVLLVKRWKKLPSGSNRNWHHVVDARAGPGTKSIIRIKNNSNKAETFKKHTKKHKHSKVVRRYSDDIGDDELGNRNNRHRFNTPSPVYSDMSDDSNELPGEPVACDLNSKFSSFLDLSYWKKTKICCGIIFKGPNGEVMVDPSLLRPCKACTKEGKKDADESKADIRNSDGESNASTEGEKFVESPLSLPIKDDDDCDYMETSTCT